MFKLMNSLLLELNLSAVIALNQWKPASCEERESMKHTLGTMLCNAPKNLCVEWFLFTYFDQKQCYYHFVRCNRLLWGLITCLNHLYFWWISNGNSTLFTVSHWDVKGVMKNILSIIIVNNVIVITIMSIPISIILEFIPALIITFIITAVLLSNNIVIITLSLSVTLSHHTHYNGIIIISIIIGL